MTEYLEKLILDNWQKWGNGEKPEHLDFLKTHAGNATRNKKVGFFVFNNKRPFIFVKTVRENRYNYIVEDEFKNLEKIYGLLNGISVPKPIYRGDYQGMIFTLEGAVVGTQFHSFKKTDDLNRFWGWFLSFQKLMASGDRLDGDELNAYFTEVVERFLNIYSLGEESRKQIIDLAKSFEGNIGGLALISQHGDLTPDNVLDSNGEIKAIDWGNFGKINLPLFDLLVFLQRWSGIRNIDFIKKYRGFIENYLKEFKIDEKLLKRLVFSYYLLDFIRKKDILTDYDKVYLGERLREIKETDF
jgi:hypothetical protein